jgi:hypothetical protein
VQIKLLFHFFHRVFHSDAVFWIYLIDQPRDAVVFILRGSCSQTLALVADHWYGLALIQSVRSVLGFAFVANSIFTTKDTKSFFDQTLRSVRDYFIVLDKFLGAASHRTLYFESVQLFLHRPSWTFTRKLFGASLRRTFCFVLKMLLYTLVTEQEIALFAHYGLVRKTFTTLTCELFIAYRCFKLIVINLE